MIMKKIKFLALIMSALLSANFAWGADPTVTLDFEGTGTFPYNADWTCEGSEGTLNHTTGGSKCASFNFTTAKYITYAKSLYKIKSVSFWGNRTSNNTTHPTITVEISTDDGKTWGEYGSAQPSLAKNSWTQGTITLGTPTTGKIRLRYNCTSNAVKYIDDIVITYTTSEPAYTVTAVSNDENLGTVSGTTTITASPEECVGYADLAYTVTPDGKATVAQSGNTFTVSNVTDNVTVTINFVALTPDTYEDHLHNNTTIEECGSYTAPSLDDATKATTGDCDLDHYHFAGWVTSPISTGTPGAPDGMVTAGTAMNSNGAKYIAVWAKEDN